MLALGLQPVTIPGEVATKASTTIIESGVLGALLVIAVLAIVALVWLLVRVQNARVEDIKKVNELSAKMVETFANVNKTLEDLDDGIEEQARALQALHATMQSILISRLAQTGMPQLPAIKVENDPTGGTR